MSDTLPSFRPEKYIWLRAQASLDLADIDEAIQEMGVLIQEAGECSALANELRELAKDELEQQKSIVADYLRKEPYKDKQRSESMIDSQIPIYPDYINAQTKLSNARRDASLWATVVEALRAKSMQIRVAADLLNSGFLTSDFIRDKRRRAIRQANPEIKDANISA